MNNSTVYAGLAAALLLAVPALAQTGLSQTGLSQTGLEGNWKLTLGKKAPCDVAIGADGAVTSAADCPAAVARWKSTSTGVQLQTASGETYAVLKPKGASFEGTTFADERTITLSR